MLKKTIFLVGSLLIIAIAGVALAQEATNAIATDQSAIIQATTTDEAVTAQDLGVAEPSLLPDSKFYFLKNWQRSIKMAFTFNQVDKAELNLKHASEKLLEARKLAEKTNNPQILDKATELYNKKIEAISANVEKFKETASTSPRISKFLNKYTQQRVLQEQILDKLEGKVPTSTLEKIKANREKRLEKFKDVMEKVGNKEQIKTAKEKIDNLKSKIEEKIKNRLENKLPGDTGQIYDKENCQKNPAQFKFCQSDQSCRRIWQICPITTNATTTN